MASVGSGSGIATIGAGRMYLGGPEEAAVSFVLHTDPELDGRYSVEHGEATKHLGRAATVVEVIEAGSVRVRMVVDDSTSAPVATEVFDGDGELFRYSAMTEFSVWVDPAMAAVRRPGIPDDAAARRSRSPDRTCRVSAHRRLRRPARWTAGVLHRRSVLVLRVHDPRPGELGRDRERRAFRTARTATTTCVSSRRRVSRCCGMPRRRRSRSSATCRQTISIRCSTSFHSPEPTTG